MYHIFARSTHFTELDWLHWSWSQLQFFEAVHLHLFTLTIFCWYYDPQAQNPCLPTPSSSICIGQAPSTSTSEKYLDRSLSQNVYLTAFRHKWPAPSNPLPVLQRSPSFSKHLYCCLRVQMTTVHCQGKWFHVHIVNLPFQPTPPSPAFSPLSPTDLPAGNNYLRLTSGEYLGCTLGAAFVEQV